MQVADHLGANPRSGGSWATSLFYIYTVQAAYKVQSYIYRSCRALQAAHDVCAVRRSASAAATGHCGRVARARLRCRVCLSMPIPIATAACRPVAQADLTFEWLCCHSTLTLRAFQRQCRQPSAFSNAPMFGRARCCQQYTHTWRCLLQ